MAMTKAAEFGLLFETERAGDSVARAKLAEELGFASYWVPEDYAFPGAFATCAAVAAATKRIKIGIGVLNPYTRHPVLTAMEFGALDQIAGGRAILGVGAGVRLWIEDQLGIPYTRPITAMREAVAITRTLFRGETLSHAGRAFTAHGLHFSLDPARRDIPIHLGATGTRSLRLAGEIADGVLLNVMLGEDYVRSAVQSVHDGAASVGRDLTDFAMGALLWVSMSDDEAWAYETARPIVGWLLWLFARQPELPIFAEAGLTSAQVAQLAESPQPIAEFVSDRVLDRFVLVGSPARCREGLARVIEAGVTHPVLCVLPVSNDPEGDLREIVQQLVQPSL
jgi:5,10-methylenetetrahydromethanopterin reductase